MGKVIIFIAAGLMMLGAAGWFLFPNARTDIIQNLPFFGSNSRRITLTYWGLWEPREVIQPLLDEYQQQHSNITIEYEMRDPRDHYQTLDARLGGEGAPDIVRVHPSWIPFLKGKLLPIPKDVMSTEEYEASFYPVNQVFNKQDNAYYGIPLMIDGLALAYNRNLFLKEGIVNPPKTWNDFRDLAARLTKTNSSGDLVQSGAALGFASNIDYFPDILGLMFAQNGVQFMDSTGKVTIHTSTSPIGSNLASEALRFYTLFATSEKSWDPLWRNSTEEFIAGRVAMVLVPSHRILQILAGNPNFEVGVTTVPQLPVVGTQTQAVNWGNYWVESVARTSPYGKEAWKFVRWLSEKDQLSKLYKNASEVRAFGEAYPRVDMASELSAETFLSPYVQQGSSYTTWFFTSGTYNNVVNDRINSVLKEIVELVVDGDDPQGGIIRLATQAQQIIDAAKSKK